MCSPFSGCTPVRPYPLPGGDARSEPNDCDGGSGSGGQRLTRPRSALARVTGSASTVDGAETVGEKRSFDKVLAEEHGLLVGHSRFLGATQTAEEVGPGRCQVAVRGQEGLVGKMVQSFQPGG